MASVPASLAGKTALVTGSTSGIGLELATLLASLGASVMVHGRSPAKCEAAVALVRSKSEVRPDSEGAQRVTAAAAEMSDLDEVRALAAATRAQFPDGLDLLFLNAGMGYGGHEGPSVSASSGMDLLYTSNNLGPFLLAKELLPLVEKVDGAVVITSSVLQWGGEPARLAQPEAFEGKGTQALAAYANSKLAVAVWAAELGEQLKARGARVRVRSFAPGMVKSSIAVPIDKRNDLISPSSSSASSSSASSWFDRRFETHQGARYTLMAAFTPGDDGHLKGWAPYRVPGFLLGGPQPWLARTIALWLAENAQKLTARPDSLFVWPAHPAVLDADLRQRLWHQWVRQFQF